jgi:protoheme IX farnesyltransferase
VNEALEAAPAGGGQAARTTRLRDLLELSKARIVAMLLMTAAAGYLAAGAGGGMRLFNLLLGTALMAGGANALNQYLERDFDRRMRRTCSRPLPAGRIGGRAALGYAVAAALAGLGWLGAFVGWQCAALGAAALAVYVALYTPLKRHSPLCTPLGALPGALPALMGWTAVRGFDPGGLILFGVVLLWQIPHFMAISWLCREDYRRAGFAMLSVRDPDGGAVARRAAWCAALLFAPALAPAALGMAGAAYLACAAAAGIVLLASSLAFLRERTAARARGLFAVSNGYLVALVTLWMLLVRG